jgi:hypothetical protein
MPQFRNSEHYYEKRYKWAGGPQQPVFAAAGLKSKKNGVEPRNPVRPVFYDTIR